MQRIEQSFVQAVTWFYAQVNHNLILWTSYKMNEEETPAMEFVQHMEYTAAHGVRRLLVFVNYFSNVSPCLSQKTKTNLKEKLFKDMTVIQY